VTDEFSIRILRLRGKQVILDKDLAFLYGVKTKRLNEQIKRNADKFPYDFMFELTAEEKRQVVANCDHLKNLVYSRVLPRGFTEHGALMAATVLNSERANKMSLYLIRAFVEMRKEMCTHNFLIRRLAEIENVLMAHDRSLGDLYSKLAPLLNPPMIRPRRKAGFDAGND